MTLVHVCFNAFDMENCQICGEPLQVIKDQPYKYGECGLDVVLLGITQYHCEKCGEDFAAIPSPQKLHRIIGFHICKENKALLQPKEIQFLRKELRLKAKELARILGVSDSVVSRWENGKAAIGEGNDRLLRSIFIASVNEISEIHDSSMNILDLFMELPHKRKEIKTPHSINLNPQEWMQSECLHCLRYMEKGERPGKRAISLNLDYSLLFGAS